MSCGLPVVCSNLPQLRTITNNCGKLVNKMDAIGFSKSIESILQNNDIYRKFGENARNKIVDKYSWNDTVNKTIKFFSRV